MYCVAKFTVSLTSGTARRRRLVLLRRPVAPDARRDRGGLHTVDDRARPRCRAQSRSANGRARLPGLASRARDEQILRGHSYRESGISSATLRHTKLTCKGETQATPLLARFAWSAIRESIFRDNGQLGARG